MILLVVHTRISLWLTVIFVSVIADKCPTPLVKDHKNLDWDPKLPDYKVNFTISWSCFSGYRLVGTAKSICQENGKFTERPICEPSKCHRPIVKNLNASPDKDIFNFKDMITWSCNLGYKLDGEKKSWCGMNERFTDIPTCEVSQCVAPNFSAHNLLLKSDSKLTYEFGELMEFECKSGDVLNGSSFSKCQKDGSFTTLSYCVEHRKLTALEETLNRMEIDLKQLNEKFKKSLEVKNADNESSAPSFGLQIVCCILLTVCVIILVSKIIWKYQKVNQQVTGNGNGPAPTDPSEKHRMLSNV